MLTYNFPLIIHSNLQSLFLLQKYIAALLIASVMNALIFYVINGFGLRNMIGDPDPEAPMSPDIANMYKNNRAEHDKIAREWTKKFAM